MVRPNIIGRSLWKPMVKAMGFFWLISIGKPLEHQIHWFIYIYIGTSDQHTYIYIYMDFQKNHWIKTHGILVVDSLSRLRFWIQRGSPQWFERRQRQRGHREMFCIFSSFFFGISGNPFFYSYLLLLWLLLFVIVVICIIINTIIVIIITIVIIMVLLYYSIIVIICIYPVVRSEGCGAMVVPGAKELLRVSQPHYCYYYRMLLLLWLWFNCAYGTYYNCIG